MLYFKKCSACGKTVRKLYPNSHGEPRYCDSCHLYFNTPRRIDGWIKSILKLAFKRQALKMAEKFVVYMVTIYTFNSYKEFCRLDEYYSTYEKALDAATRWANKGDTRISEIQVDQEKEQQ